MAQLFDPFSDRTSRDIRNSLSTALVVELTSRRGGSVVQAVDSWLDRVHQPVYREYILQCRKQYSQVLHSIGRKGIQDPRMQAVELWNAGLFFELHELLETVWHGAHGDARVGLKGLIQAAGAYVHLRRGKLKAARGLARRARMNLTAGSQALGFVANLEDLVESLKEMPASAPVLSPNASANDPVASDSD